MPGVRMTQVGSIACVAEMAKEALAKQQSAPPRSPPPTRAVFPGEG